MMAEFVDKVSKTIAVNEQQGMLTNLLKFRGNDLELILGELDTIIDLDYATGVQGYLRVAGAGQPVPFSLERDVALKLRTRLKHAIIREYRNVDSSKTAEIYNPLFDAVFLRAKKGAWLPIFTTNYDPAIEEFCQREYPRYQLCDGFVYDPADRHNSWNRSAFDDFEGHDEKRNLILFKLHGSADWLLVKSNQRIRRG